AHRLRLGVVAALDGRVGAQVVYPDRVRRRPTHGPDEDIVGAVRDAHQWGLAGRTGLVACVGHDNHRQPGIAERGAVGPATALVELDLVTHPLSGTGNVLCHGLSSIQGRWASPPARVSAKDDARGGPTGAPSPGHVSRRVLPF